jgi:hypothetical protein
MLEILRMIWVHLYWYRRYLPAILSIPRRILNYLFFLFGGQHFKCYRVTDNDGVFWSGLCNICRVLSTFFCIIVWDFLGFYLIKNLVVMCCRPADWYKSNCATISFKFDRSKTPLTQHQSKKNSNITIKVELIKNNKFNIEIHVLIPTIESIFISNQIEMIIS